MRSILIAILAGATLTGCGDDPDQKGAQKVAPAGPEPATQAPEPTLRRLTRLQYRHAVAELFGPDVLLTVTLEPDVEQDGLLSIGAATAAVSPYGVETYEDAAYELAEQVMEPGALRDRLVPCAPGGPSDDGCAGQALETLARAAWRSTPTTAEVAELVDIASHAGDTLGDFYDGLEYGVAAILQSPRFLYRAELGDAGRLTDAQLASRISFFLWNAPPDEALRNAAQQGFDDPAALEAQVDRLLADPRAREGFANFVDELLTLYHLDSLSKDPTVFPAMRADLGESARAETLMAVDALVFDRDEDFRNWLTTRQTYVDPILAMLYAVPAPDLEGHAPIELPEDGPRRGLLGQVSVLAQHAHPVSTSATRRGMFVREVLLCQTVPPPPAGLNTAIPEPSQDAKTLRERVKVHLEDPMCATCHLVTDPIGLGLENYDGLGSWRSTENGATIDPGGDVDGVAFADAWELGETIGRHPDFPTCMAQTLFAYGVGRLPGPDEAAAMEWLGLKFRDEGYSMKQLLRTIALSEAFRASGEVTP